MKWISKALIAAMTLIVLFSVVPTTNAEVFVVDPGETVSFTIEYDAAVAIEGKIRFSDGSIISNVQYDISGSNLEGLAENGKFFLYTGNPEGESGVIVITITVYSTVEKGSSSVVTLTYNITEPGSNTPGTEQVISNIVTIRTDQEPTEPEKETEPTKPTTVDLSKLKAQIELVEGLTPYDFTKDTWEPLKKAVEEGKALLYGASQKKVDEATRAIEEKLAVLVPMDYSQLQTALDAVGKLESVSGLSGQWDRFMRALENARFQRTSGDQAAVDAATEELLASRDALVDELLNMGELVVVEKEVPVEIEPTYKYCNDSSHTLFLILMIISLVLNAALVVLIGVYVFKKHIQERDRTPLVEYEIGDDDEYLEG